MFTANEVDDLISQLDDTCKKMFFDYGLRQIKYMFDNDSVMTDPLPAGAVLIGLGIPFMRWGAIDNERKIRYGYFRGQTPAWSESNDFNSVVEFDKVEDFKKVYDTFNLSEYTLNDLTTIHIEASERLVKISNDNSRSKS